MDTISSAYLSYIKPHLLEFAVVGFGTYFGSPILMRNFSNFLPGDVAMSYSLLAAGWAVVGVIACDKLKLFY